MYLQASDQAINGLLIPGIDYRLINKLISSSDNEQKAAIRGELLGALPRIVTDTTGKTIVRPSDQVWIYLQTTLRMKRQLYLNVCISLDTLKAIQLQMIP